MVPMMKSQLGTLHEKWVALYTLNIQHTWVSDNEVIRWWVCVKKSNLIRLVCPLLLFSGKYSFKKKNLNLNQNLNGNKT
jgi:hypothetical protein